VAQSSQVEGPDMFVWNDEAKTTREVAGHFADLTANHPVPPGQVVLGGFSMGGGEAMRLAVSGLVPARGFIAVVPYFRDLAGLKVQIARLEPGALRGYIITGDKDFSYQAALEAAEAFRGVGIACEVEERQGLGHALPGDFARSLKRALAFVRG
jgi:predicted esterase